MAEIDRRAHFESIAADWDHWRGKNRYYHDRLTEFVAGVVAPGGKLLDVGAGTGDLLAALPSEQGIGLNLGKELNEEAKRKYPDLDFRTFDIDNIELPDGFVADHVVMVNMLDHVHDIWDLLESLAPHVGDHSLLVLTSTNPLWAPVLRLGSRLHMRVPESPRNYLTSRDILSVLELQGWDCVETGFLLPVPRRLPVVGNLLNLIVPDIPLLRYGSSVQYLAARPRRARQPLSVSVVIPCHNEAGNIAECIARTPNFGERTEIVVVDDGSRDATRQVVQTTMATDPRVRLVGYDTNHGKANAVRAGFAAATGDVLMILDADMTVAPEDLPKFLRPLQEGTADFVNGTRLIYPMAGQAMPLANFLGNKAFCFLTSWALRQRVSDTLCGTKALFRTDYERMPLVGKERWGDFDLLFGAARQRLRILEIPVHYGDRKAGDSKMNVQKDGLLFMKACLSGWRSLRSPRTLPWEHRVPPAPGAQAFE